MQKLFPMILILCLLLTGCGKSSEPLDETAGQEVEPPISQMGNPWTDHGTLADAEKEVGFEMSVPDSIEGYDAPIYRTLSGTMLEILYPAANGEIRIRKQAATDAVGNDISGDYNEYDEYTAISTAGEDATCTLAGNGGAVSRATWTVGGYTYSITVEPAMEVVRIAELTAQVN